MSGLSAAITAASALQNQLTTDPNIVLLEAQSTLGGRVQSDTTPDGYILDRGFAVFIENYPTVKEFMDYDSLDLKPFIAGAVVKLNDHNDLKQTGGEGDKLQGNKSLSSLPRFARVVDPLRHPRGLLSTVFTPIGVFKDKICLLPFYLHIIRTSIPEFFEEAEMDTLSCLKNAGGF